MKIFMVYDANVYEHMCVCACVCSCCNATLYYFPHKGSFAEALNKRSKLKEAMQNNPPFLRIIIISLVTSSYLNI